MEKTTEKKPLFTMRRIVTALVCFAAFLAVSMGGYYISAGEFASAKLAAICAALALAGALAVFFRLRRFAFFYYMGCGLGWVVGWRISGLKGEFAPAFGTICTIGFIAVFSVLGIMSQWDGMKKRREKRRAAEAKAALEAEEERIREEQAAEEARKQEELDAARQARGEAEAAMAQAAGGPPVPKAPTGEESAQAVPVLQAPGEEQ